MTQLSLHGGTGPLEWPARLIVPCNTYTHTRTHSLIKTRALAPLTGQNKRGKTGQVKTSVEEEQARRLVGPAAASPVHSPESFFIIKSQF